MQARQPQRRIPIHADTGAGPGHRQGDRAAQRPEVVGADSHADRDRAAVLAPDRGDSEPTHTNCLLNAAVSRREPRLRVRRTRARRQHPPHRRPIAARPRHRKPVRGRAPATAAAGLRAPHHHTSHNRGQHHQHAEHKHTAAGPRPPANSTPAPYAPAARPRPATGLQHRSRPRPRRDRTRTTTSHVRPLYLTRTNYAHNHRQPNPNRPGSLQRHHAAPRQFTPLPPRHHGFSTVPCLSPQRTLSIIRPRLPLASQAKTQTVVLSC
jgi:hypothetical protein